jgi:signal transduction histidine kinase
MPARPAGRPPGLTIRGKLILAVVVPAAGLLGVFGAVMHAAARGTLDRELAVRLSAVAAAAATHLRDETLAKLGPGDEQDVRYLQCRARLQRVAESTGAVRIYAFNRDLVSACDSDPSQPIGSPYYQLERDSPELSRVFEHGESVSSVLFEGSDGRLYKAGYAAAARDRAGQVVLAVGVDAPAEYFGRLADLRDTIILTGALVTFALLAISVVMAALLARPVRALAAAADRIGRGDLSATIAAGPGDEIGLLAATMDEMRRGLQARDERMQMMLSGIAHEVRNPLGGMQLFAGILRDELADRPESLEHVARIESEIGHLKAVVEDFLDYARRPAPQPVRVELGELAAELTELMRGDAEAAGVSLACAAADAVCRADREQLRRALLNLLRNAVQAAVGSAPAVAGIRAHVAGDAAIIEVYNRGPAISDEVRERIFEPFFTTKEKGTGLGLAFVRDIVREQGGAVDVHRTGDGHTIFRLIMPRG